MGEKDALNSAKCLICSEDYSERVTELYYCLCDSAVCSKCIKDVQVNEKEWKCPNCEKIVELELTKLFRKHDD